MRKRGQRQVDFFSDLCERLYVPVSLYEITLNLYRERESIDVTFRLLYSNINSLCNALSLCTYSLLRTVQVAVSLRVPHAVHEVEKRGLYLHLVDEETLHHVREIGKQRADEAVEMSVRSGGDSH